MSATLSRSWEEEDEADSLDGTSLRTGGDGQTLDWNLTVTGMVQYTWSETNWKITLTPIKLYVTNDVHLIRTHHGASLELNGSGTLIETGPSNVSRMLLKHHSDAIRVVMRRGYVML